MKIELVTCSMGLNRSACCKETVIAHNFKMVVCIYAAIQSTAVGQDLVNFARPANRRSSDRRVKIAVICVSVLGKACFRPAPNLDNHIGSR